MSLADRTGAPGAVFRPIRRALRPQLVDETIQRLRSRLASGEFKVGDKIPPESVLIEQLGIGRTTLREAVRVLEHEGLLVVRQGSGTYLRSVEEAGILSVRLRQARVLEVLEVRRALELEITRLAAIYRTEAALAAIGEALDRMRRSFEAADESSFLDADMEIYRILAAETRNSILIEIHTSFSNALRLALTQVVAVPGVMQNCLGRHEQLYEAIFARDGDLAEAIARAHLERLTRLIKDLLGDARVDDADRARAADESELASGDRQPVRGLSQDPSHRY